MRKKFLIIARYNKVQNCDKLFELVENETPLFENPEEMTDIVLWNKDRMVVFMVEENVHAKNFSDLIKGLRKKYAKTLETDKITLVAVN